MIVAHAIGRIKVAIGEEDGAVHIACTLFGFTGAAMRGEGEIRFILWRRGGAWAMLMRDEAIGALDTTNGMKAEDEIVDPNMRTN